MDESQRKDLDEFWMKNWMNQFSNGIYGIYGWIMDCPYLIGKYSEIRWLIGALGIAALSYRSELEFQR